MKIIDEDCLAETLKFNRTFEAREVPLEVLRRNRLGGDTPPVRLPQGQNRVVNGVPVIDHGEMTGALPGKVLRGPGFVP